MSALVTRSQLITTCLSSAAGAVVLGWALARPDVWALQDSINRLSSAVKELKVHQSQNVTLGYDRNQTIRDILDRKFAANGVYTGRMRGTVSTEGRSFAGDERDSVGASGTGGGSDGGGAGASDGAAADHGL